jgi:hypothetical protein
MTKNHNILITFIFVSRSVVKQDLYVYGTFVELGQFRFLTHAFEVVLRIRDVYPGSRIPDLGSRISDPGSRIPDLGSRISDPGSRIPDYRTFNPKKCHYALKNIGLGSRIRNPRSGIRNPGSKILDPRSGKNLSRIPDPGVKKATDPGSWIPEPDPQHWFEDLPLCSSTVRSYYNGGRRDGPRIGL